MVWRATNVLTTLFVSLATIRHASTISSSGQIVFCTYDFQPYTTCTNDGGIYGIGSSIVNTIEATQGNEFFNDYTIRCLSSRTEVLDKLKSCECDVGVGDFNEAAFNLIRSSNMSISYPYRPEAYGIITRRKPRESTIWGLFRPFTVELWILVGMTPLMLAVAMTFFSWAISKYKKTSFSISLLPQYAFQNTMSFLNEYTSIEYMDWHGHSPYMLTLKFMLQSMLVAFAFLCLIVTSVYTAQLTNVILTREFFQEELSFTDTMRTLDKLISPPELIPFFQTIYNRETTVWVPDSTQNFTDQLDRIRRGETDGLIASVGAGLWALKTKNEDCRLDLNPHSYKLVNGQVFVFSPCLDQGVIDQRNRVILEIGQRGILEAQSKVVLGEFYVTTPPSVCNIRESAVTIHDLAGGWVILAVAVCLPLVATIARYLYYLARKCITMYGNIFVVTTPPGSDPAISNRGSEEIHLDMKSAEAMYAAWARGGEAKHEKGRDVRLSTDHNVRLSTESCSKCSKHTDPSSHGRRSYVSSEYPATPAVSVASGYPGADTTDLSPNISPILTSNLYATRPSPFSNVDASGTTTPGSRSSDSPPLLETIRTDNTSSPGLVFRDDV